MNGRLFRSDLHRRWRRVTIPILLGLGLCLHMSNYQLQLRAQLRTLISESSAGQYYVATRIDDNAENLTSWAPAFCDILSVEKRKRVQIFSPDGNIIGDSKDTFIKNTDDIIAANRGTNGYQYFLSGPFLYVSMSSPITEKGQTIGVLRYVQEHGVFLIGSNIAATLGVCTVAMAIWYAISALAAERSARPIEEIQRILADTGVGEPLPQPPNLPVELDSLLSSHTRIHEQNRRYVLRLRQEREKQSLFFSNATHQLKTPLTSIIGYSDMIEKLSDDPEIVECGEYIQQAGKKLLKMVDSMLDISRYRHSDYEFTPEWFTLRELVEQCRNMLAPRLKLHAIELVNSCGEEEIYLDHHSAQDMLLNILDNAIRHSGCSRITVTTATVPVRMIVQDNGTGIDSQRLLQIFEPFYRTKGSLNMGSGLGLAICREMLVGQGGDITVESTPGQGACFTLFFQDKDQPHRLIRNMARRI